MVRFFKLFDGNLDLLERLKSTIGQVILVIVFMMGLFLVGNPMVLLIGSALLFLALYPQKRWNIIFIFTLLHWFLGLRPGWKAVYKISKQWKLNFGYVEFYTMELFVLVTVLTFIFILLKLSQKIKFISDRPLSHIITVYLIVHIPIVFMEERTLFSFFYWACLIIFIQFYWYFAYAVYDQERNRGASWIKKISALHPFWSGGKLIPIPGGLASMEKIEVKNNDEKIIWQIKGLKLLLWVIGLKIALYALDYVVPSKNSPFLSTSIFLTIPFFQQVSDWMQRSQSEMAISTAAGFQVLLMRWVLMLRLFVGFLLEIMIIYGQIVAVARMAGFAAFRHTYRPLKAKKFSEFLGRWMYYYSLLLQKFFVMPLFLKLRFLKQSSIRTFLAFFFGLLLLAILYHWGWFISKVPQQGFMTTIISYSYCLPYFVVLALSVSVPTLRFVQNNSLKIPKVLRVVFYIIWYATLLSLARFLFVSGTFQEYFHFMKVLFLW